MDSFLLLCFAFTLFTCPLNGQSLALTDRPGFLPLCPVWSPSSVPFVQSRRVHCPVSRCLFGVLFTTPNLFMLYVWEAMLFSFQHAAVFFCFVSSGILLFFLLNTVSLLYFECFRILSSVFRDIIAWKRMAIAEQNKHWRQKAKREYGRIQWFAARRRCEQELETRISHTKHCQTDRQILEGDTTEHWTLVASFKNGISKLLFADLKVSSEGFDSGIVFCLWQSHFPLTSDHSVLLNDHHKGHKGKKYRHQTMNSRMTRR